MRYIEITSSVIPIYFIADKDKIQGISLTFYSNNLTKLKLLRRLLYNIKEGKFYRNQKMFRVIPAKDELEDLNGKFYKINLIIKMRSIKYCLIILSRISKRIADKFTLKPIFNSQDKIKRYFTYKLNRHFLND